MKDTQSDKATLEYKMDEWVRRWVRKRRQKDNDGTSNIDKQLRQKKWECSIMNYKKVTEWRNKRKWEVKREKKNSFIHSYDFDATSLQPTPTEYTYHWMGQFPNKVWEDNLSCFIGKSLPIPWTTQVKLFIKMTTSPFLLSAYRVIDGGLSCQQGISPIIGP